MRGSSCTSNSAKYATGFDLATLPRLPIKDYPKGKYMPMGIGVPPFFQSYEDLQKTPPEKSSYVSVLLDEQDRWIDHHAFAIDGPVLHRDENDPHKRTIPARTRSPAGMA